MTTQINSDNVTNSCKCCDSKTAYQDIIKQHDTLEEFTKAIWKACDHLFLTVEEARKGIAEYAAHLGNAPR